MLIRDACGEVTGSGLGHEWPLTTYLLPLTIYEMRARDPGCVVAGREVNRLLQCVLLDASA